MTQTMPASLAFLSALFAPPAKRSREDARPGLMNDQRGAVMLTGLFMSFVLIGGLWFVIGMGEAIIFRDRMQEAADHGAFTSASIQANGMNFISALNLIMLMLAIVHIILGVIQDCLRIGCASILLSAVACPAMFWEFNLWTNVSRVCKYGMTAIHYVEQVASIGYPWIGTWKAHTVGGKYDASSGSIVKGSVTVLAAGRSNIPITGTGLPVEAKPYSFLCKKVGMVLGRLIGDAVSSFGIPLGGRIGGWAGRFLGPAVEFRYCNSLGNNAARAAAAAAEQSMNEASTNADASDQRERDREAAERQAQQDNNGQGTVTPARESRDGNNGFNVRLMGGGWQPLIDPGIDRGFGNPGPYVVSNIGKNGKMGTRVFAVNLNPKYTDTNTKRVSAGQALKAGNSWAPESTDEGAIFYVAEAEFYYDCKSTWTNRECDFSDDDRYASFSFKWRARLRRLDMPNFLGTIGNVANNFQNFQAAAQDILGQIGNNPLAQAVGLSTLTTQLSNSLNVIGDLLRLDPLGIAGGSYH